MDDGARRRRRYYFCSSRNAGTGTASKHGRKHIHRVKHTIAMGIFFKFIENVADIMSVQREMQVQNVDVGSVFSVGANGISADSSVGMMVKQTKVYRFQLTHRTVARINTTLKPPNPSLC